MQSDPVVQCPDNVRPLVLKDTNTKMPISIIQVNSL